MVRTLLVSGLMMLTVMVSTVTMADPAPQTVDCGGPRHGPHGDMHGHMHGHGWHRYGARRAMLLALRRIDLTEAQKHAIRAAVDASRKGMKDQWRMVMQPRRAFERAVPGTQEFNTAYMQYAQAAAAAAEGRIQRQANLRTEIYGMLTVRQRGQFAEALARPHPRRGGNDAAPSN